MRRFSTEHEHRWRELGRGATGEVCLDCKTRFPCPNKDCPHVDCWDYRGYAICHNCEKKMIKMEFALMDDGRSSYAACQDCMGDIHVSEAIKS